MADLLSPTNIGPPPQGIQGRHDVIFGNMKEIYEFHKE